jgi:5-methylcytosine-specific restriction endonuclease McrA
MEVEKILAFFGPTNLEVKKAFVNIFPPLQPGVMRQNWRVNRAFGYDAPSTSEFWDLFTKSDFRCSLCSSQYRITVDHINGDNKDHRIENLQVLCQRCNTTKANEGVRNPNAQVVIFTEFNSYIEEHGEIPTTRQLAKQIKSKYNFKNRPLSGYLYLYRFYVFRYHNPRTVGNLNECLETINSYSKYLDVDEEEIRRALISYFSAPDEFTTAGNWRNGKRYGNSSPPPSVFRELLEEYNYQCGNCDEASKLTFDHIDGDPTNHDKSNLMVLCFLCNRAKSKKGVKRPNFKVTVFERMIEVLNETGNIPTTVELTRELGHLSGERYSYKYFRIRLEAYMKS